MGKGGRSGRIVKDFGPTAPTGNSKKPAKTATAKGKSAAKREKDEAEIQTKTEAPLEAAVSLKLQQLTLNIFKDTFPEILASDTLQSLLQEVKAALYDRDFERAFGRKDYLEAYSVRWSPSRALCYMEILVDLRPYLANIFSLCRHGQSDVETPLASTLKVISMGGGAAEIVAFGGFTRSVQDTSAQSMPETPAMDLRIQSMSVADHVTENLPLQSIEHRKPDIDLLLVDSASWQDVCSRLHAGLTTLPTLSKYANALARATNSQLIPTGSLNSACIVENALEMEQSRLNDILGTEPVLCTLLFTLNELYTASISKTTTFLMDLTAAARAGTLLLVVDSPGSYSETQVGTEAKKYPMKWLLDHTLLDPKRPQATWDKIISDDSKWFRLPDSLKYPIPLENMRYQLHLYRRL